MAGDILQLESMELRVVILWWKRLRRNNVINVEGIMCWKCLGEIMLLVVDALLIGKKRAGNSPEIVRELSQKYGEEHKAEKKAYNQEYNI